MKPLVAVASLLLAGAALAATTPLPPRPSRYVTDRAGVFAANPARLTALEQQLAAFERETSNQVIVYIDRDLPPGTTLEEMGAAAIRSWGVGQKGRLNGVILFAFITPRAMRLEVGYGLEGSIPDARARQITSEVIRPLFRAGDYASGVEAGVRAILAAARGEAFRGTGRTVAETGAPAGQGSGRVWVGILIITIFFVILPVVFVLVLVSRFRRRGVGSPGPSSWTSSSDSSSSDSYASSSPFESSSSSSSSDSSSSSSSDFSGGGGDGGGGGSSDSW
jgi:uncharacterized protein